MIYLAANNTRVWRLAQLGFPLGWMMSPAGWMRPVRGNRQMPYALDNGLYHPFGTEPRPASAIGHFYGMLAKAAEHHEPLFAVAPDVPYSGPASIVRSERHASIMRELGYGGRIALAVQDGMTPDVLDDGRWQAVFVAGSTAWKWATMAEWVEAAKARGLWAHVARVNTQRRIRQCMDAGADSADGTGIFRGDKVQLATVLAALRERVLFAGATP